MADYPCDYHLARYAGSSTRLYLNVYRDETEAKFRFSVCDDCLADIVTQWVGHALHQSPAGNWDPPVDGETLEDLLIASVRPSGHRNVFGRR